MSKDLTLAEAINLAGGLTEFGSKDAINIVQTFTSVDENSIELKEEFKVGNIDLNLMVSDGMVINILPIQNTLKLKECLQSRINCNIKKCYLNVQSN